MYSIRPSHLSLLLACGLISASMEAAPETPEGHDSDQSCPAHVVLRYDDVTEHSELELEQELYSQAARIGATVLVGVVPMLSSVSLDASSATAPTDVAMKIKLLNLYSRMGVIEVALHGYQHQNIKGADSKSEFSGATLAEQRMKVDQGAQWMMSTLDIKPWVFIPPWNSYDEGTLRALMESGISLISAARSGPVTGSSSLSFLPGTSYPQQLEEAITEFERAGDCGALLVIVMHPFDFDGGGDMPSFRHSKQISMPQFFKTLATLKRTGRIEFLSARALAKEGGGGIDGRRFEANVSLSNSKLVQRRLIPQQLIRYPESKLYYSMAAARQVRRNLVLTALAYFGAVIVLAGLFGFVVTAYRSRTIAITVFFLASGISTILGTWLWISGNYAKAMTVFMIGIGVFLPALIRATFIAHGNCGAIFSQSDKN